MKAIITCLLVVSSMTIFSQSEIEKINQTLNKYIEGTAFGNQEMLKEAFEDDFRLFLVSADTLRVIEGKQYINNVEPGKKYNRIANIVSIDYSNDAAVAKIEVFFPERKQVATDYLLLLKENKQWKIIHKIINLKSIEMDNKNPVNETNNIIDLNTTLLNYIQGTANGELGRIKEAFQTGFNLYYVKENAITVLPGERYMSNFKEGQKSNRIGKVLGVDFEGDAGFAKIEVRMPERNRRVIDYLLLLNIEDNWKIIHKSFTTQNYE